MAEDDALPPSPPNAWDDFLEASRPDIGHKQRSWWAEVLLSRGWGQFEVLVGDEDDVILGGARVYIESFAPDTCYYYVPDAPVLPDDPEDAAAVFDATLAYMDEQRQADPWTVSHVRIEPRWEQLPPFVTGFRTSRSWKEPRNTLAVDLTPDEDAILAQMKPKGRYNIGLARRKGVTVVEDTSPQGVLDFLAIYRETFDRHGLKGHSEAYFDAFLPRALTHDRGTIFFAEYEGERLAAALVLYCGEWATYKYGGSGLAHRNLMAPYLLHFEAIRAAKARGHRWYDFYGIAPADQPDDRWAAFSVFKRKFGGRELAYVPAMDYAFDPDAYEAYRKRK